MVLVGVRKVAIGAALLLVAALALLVAGPAVAALPALVTGDEHATVTIEERPLSDDTDHVVSFRRGKTLYVCLQDLRQMVSGKTTRHGNSFTVDSFKGDSNTKSYTFTIGSVTAYVHGKPVKLGAPVVAAYQHVYVPLSFFGSHAVPTHVTMSADGRSGDIVLPASAM